MQIFEMSPAPFIWAVVTAFLWLAPAIVGAVLIEQRQRSWLLGFAAGLLLNWIGVVLAVLIAGRPLALVGLSSIPWIHSNSRGKGGRCRRSVAR